MKIRTLALVFALILLIGTVSPSVGYALACRLTADQMPASCPMRQKAQPVVAVAVPKPAEKPCCNKAEALPPKAVAQHDISGTCCCDMTSAPERAEPPAMLPAMESPVFVLATDPLRVVPSLIVTAASGLPAYDADAPRGPPRTALSPRAPPVCS